MLHSKTFIANLHPLRAAAAGAIRTQARQSSSSAPRLNPAAQPAIHPPTRPLPIFPCLAQNAARESRILSQRASQSPDPSSSGPEPPYARPSPSTYQRYHHARPLPLTYAEPLPELDIAYETWGTLSPARDNVILFFVICTNVLGGCYGSTGPSSVDPATGKPYATTFPLIGIFDMVRAQYALLDHLGIEKLYASVGSSMGAMQSLAAGWMFPSRVGKIVSISGTARSSPSSVAMRFAQRSVLMADPNWNEGFYYDGLPPHTGLKLARQIATITYRSGPEWDIRFGRKLRASPESAEQRIPALCADFLIETYLDHQGEQFCLKYDANSLIYLSKAMDLFDMTEPSLIALGLSPITPTPPVTEPVPSRAHPPPANPAPHLPELAAGLRPLANTPALILGVQSDILFPVDQQRELADALRMAGNSRVSYYELGGVWGHDTFLLDEQNVGGAIKGFLL
ncbi:Alpha/Beta hydrolase protein [Russula brevipes]|nr:Alpha/Beta hydrolase protein [Russula brevipes]